MFNELPLLKIEYQYAMLIARLSHTMHHVTYDIPYFVYISSVAQSVHSAYMLTMQKCWLIDLLDGKVKHSRDQHAASYWPVTSICRIFAVLERRLPIKHIFETEKNFHEE
jgi:hypothetical protein